MDVDPQVIRGLTPSSGQVARALRSVQALSPRLLAASLILGAASAGVSLIFSAIIIDVLFSGGRSIFAMVLLGTGTMAGAVAGGWLAQPVITRVVR